MAPLGGDSDISSGGVGFVGVYGMGCGYGGCYGHLSCSGGYGDIDDILRLYRHTLHSALTSPARCPTLPPFNLILVLLFPTIQHL